MAGVVRRGGAEDAAGCVALLRAAFPEEDLVPLVQRLLREVPGVVLLVAGETAAIRGLVLLTPCAVGGGQVGLLGPLGVTPRWQGQGLGRQLVEAAVAEARRQGLPCVMVLGDPGYYGRLGFRPQRLVGPPFPLPAGWADAWRLRVTGIAAPVPEGTLRPPAPWLEPGLWGPGAP
jgi:putative acetyltransferase